MPLLQFSDRLIPYDRFISDIADKVVSVLKSGVNDPEFICQNKAFAMFGRRNVERWRKQGKIEPCKRPGRVEYRLEELRKLQRTKQDYFTD